MSIENASTIKKTLGMHIIQIKRAFSYRHNKHHMCIIKNKFYSPKTLQPPSLPHLRANVNKVKGALKFTSGEKEKEEGGRKKEGS